MYPPPQMKCSVLGYVQLLMISQVIRVMKVDKNYRCRVRLQDWLHSGDEFSLAFKVNYIPEDLLPVTVTSRFRSVQDESTQKDQVIILNDF